MILRCVVVVVVPLPVGVNSRSLGGMIDSSGAIAGVDEVGRGCLFGPVVAAAVILPASAVAPLVDAGLTDSKKLKPAQRDRLDCQIRQVALTYGLGLSSVAEIDRLNILQASLLAMRRAVRKLHPMPRLCLVDGNQSIPHLFCEQQTVIEGDRLEPRIAAASILAKVWRDRLIQRLAEQYPGYALDCNKGYGTPVHRAGLLEQGPSLLHRRSFSPCQIAPAPQPDTTQLELLDNGL